jgi:PRC-barrel domain
MTVTRSEYPESIADRLPKDETDRTISSDKVQGTEVYSSSDEKIGQIHSVMIDKYSGQVVYAIMSFGGFLGLGERYHPLPWAALRYDEKLEGYVVGIKREALLSGPSFGSGEHPAFTDAYATGLYGHYGLIR